MSRTRSALLALALLAVAHPVFTGLLVVAPVAVVLFDARELLVPPMAWMAFAVVGSLLDRSPLPGVPVRPADEPELGRLVRETAEALEIRRPLAVRLVPTVDAAVYDRKLRGRPASVIVLGYPLVKHLSAAELRAVVAHELAHREHLDDRSSRRVLFARARLADSPPSRLAPLRHWRLALLRATRELSYAQELASDAASAQVAGPASVASALRHTERLDAAYELLAATWVDVLQAQEQWPQDLYAAMDEALRDPWVGHRVDRLVAQAPSHDDEASHPPAEERIAALGSLPDVEPGPPVPLRAQQAVESSVAELLADPGESPAQVLEVDPDVLKTEPSATELLDEVVERTGARDLGDALGRVHARVKDGSWPELAMALEPGLRSAPDEVRPDALRMVMGGTVSRLLVPRLRAAGWQPASRWVRTPLRRPDGSSVDVRDVIDEALRSGDCSGLDVLVGAAGERATRP